MFREADIFVLPTRYAVEAQPLVLLEAMASGCAIVTTRAGEIPTILDEKSCIFLGECTTSALTLAIKSLIEDDATRLRLCIAGNRRYVERFGIECHLDQWERLLQSPGRAEAPC